LETATPSDALKRLYWELHGSSGTVTVLDEDCNANGPHEAYTDRHAIADNPATIPQVAILRVSEENLDGWKDRWWDVNYEGYDDEEPAPGEVPPYFKPLTIMASNGIFITVDDYVAALHPWLLQRLDLILRAMFYYEEDYTRDPTAKWLVRLSTPAWVSVEEKDFWHNVYGRRRED
jgi:hypothetical protein